jgi:3-dehydroquinate dehydratase-1
MEASAEALIQEARAALREGPDVLEWRADYLGGRVDAPQYAAIALALRREVRSAGLIFTLRSPEEGGMPRTRQDEGELHAYREICRSGAFDAIDVELARPAPFRAMLQQEAAANEVALILSSHHFDATPGSAVLAASFAAMADAGADVAKIAVMPRDDRDVDTLLVATQHARGNFGIPLITMAMGAVGQRSRVFGFRYGASLTFACGRQASAPGQLSVADLRARWAEEQLR